MAYQVRNGDPVAILHPVFQLDGSTPFTGQAANITSTLLQPDMTPSVLPVTIVEIGSSGNYTATYTPNLDGNWKLTLENTVGDLKIIDYTITVSANFLFDVGVGATGLALTTLPRVKERLIGVAGAAEFLSGNADALLTSLISEQSAKAHRMMNRIINAATYVQHYTGDGTQRMYLRQGPLVDLTLLQKVEYSGTTSRVETLTTIEEAEYIEGGFVFEGATGRGWVELLDDVFENFRPRNYVMTFTAGFDNIPEDIVCTVTNRVLAAFVTRDAEGLESRIVGESAITKISAKASDDAMLRALAHWRFRSAFIRSGVQ